MAYDENSVGKGEGRRRKKRSWVETHAQQTDGVTQRLEGFLLGGGAWTVFLTLTPYRLSSDPDLPLVQKSHFSVTLDRALQLIWFLKAHADTFAVNHTSIHLSITQDHSTGFVFFYPDVSKDTRSYLSLFSFNRSYSRKSRAVLIILYQIKW